MQYLESFDDGYPTLHGDIQTCRTYVEMYKRQNDLVSNDYLNGKALFSEGYSQNSEDKPLSDEEVFFLIFNKLW
ncbi:hypothetical protein, partial [Vibrio sp. 10N.222.54.B11]|uniref:hypothetical protein n=1 Tax=Vibrio sp. 10N.222.54.B11 TaxID=3229635 RepID=UPI00354E646E